MRETHQEFSPNKIHLHPSFLYNLTYVNFLSVTLIHLTDSCWDQFHSICLIQNLIKTIRIGPQSATWGNISPNHVLFFRYSEDPELNHLQKSHKLLESIFLNHLSLHLSFCIDISTWLELLILNVLIIAQILLWLTRQESRTVPLSITFTSELGLT